MLSAFFINRPKFAFVIAIVTIIAGMLAIAALPIAEFPELTPPQVQVTANYPGANAGVVAESVAAVIEAEVNGVEGMTYMSSKSANDGSYTLTVTFSIETDGDTAQVNVQNRVSQAMPKLPEEVTRQGVTTGKDLDQHVDGDFGLFARRHLRRHLPLQLFEHQFARHAFACEGGLEGHKFGRARLQHAHVARARSSHSLRADGE